jgi:hypothetical protein
MTNTEAMGLLLLIVLLALPLSIGIRVGWIWSRRHHIDGVRAPWFALPPRLLRTANNIRKFISRAIEELDNV